MPCLFHFSFTIKSGLLIFNFLIATSWDVLMKYGKSKDDFISCSYMDYDGKSVPLMQEKGKQR